MAALETEAIVLHAFDYLETSRIFRLMTREAGIQSVLARGARSSRKRFGSAVDLFAEGVAHVSVRPGRELQTLTSFDLTRARPALGAEVTRFTGASMIAELTLRIPSDDNANPLFDAVRNALDRIAAADVGGTVESALGGAWQIVAALGFAPSLDDCANCHAPLKADETASFSHRAGGVLCPRCGSGAVAARRIPPSAREAIRGWVEGAESRTIEPGEARAHQRLLREFFQEHVGGERDLRAFRIWEQGAWDAA